MKRTVVAENILQCMSPEHRAALGPAGRTAAEAGARWAAGQERALQELFVADMQRRGVMVLVSTYGRKTTIRKGWPDCTLLYRGRCVCVEFKVTGGRVSDDQAECHAELARAGVPVLVAWELGAAIGWVRERLMEKAEPSGARQPAEGSPKVASGGEQQHPTPNTQHPTSNDGGPR